MNRTLTAAVALTAALGMAGLAHAQSSTSPSTSPSTMNPSSSSSTMSNPSTSGTQSPQANMSQEGQQASQQEIHQAQQQLKSQGLYRGAVDGVMGPETQTALMTFQRQHSLPQTAQLDQKTLDALNSGGSNSGAGMTGGGTTGTQQPGGAQGMTNSPAGATNPATNSGSYKR